MSKDNIEAVQRNFVPCGPHLDICIAFVTSIRTCRGTDSVMTTYYLVHLLVRLTPTGHVIKTGMSG